MIRVLALFACCLFTSASLGGKPDDAAEKDLKALVGKWKVEKAELGGKDAMAFAKDVKLEMLAGGKYKLDLLGQKDEGTFTVDPPRSPRRWTSRAPMARTREDDQDDLQDRRRHRDDLLRTRRRRPANEVRDEGRHDAVPRRLQAREEVIANRSRDDEGD